MKKVQIPNSKFQISSNDQIPKFETDPRRKLIGSSLLFVIWELESIWILEFGIYSKCSLTPATCRVPSARRFEISSRSLQFTCLW